MSHARRTYSAEYKQEAVLLAQQPGSSITDIACNLGINPANLRRWIAEYNQDHQKPFTGNGNPRDEELDKLKKEVAQLKKEQDFLREAAAYFVKHTK